MITIPQLRQLMILICSLMICAVATHATHAQEQGKLNLSHISDEAFAAVVVHPQKTLSKPEFELMPLEIIEAAGKQTFGFNPLEIEQAVGFINPPGGGGPPDWGLVLHFSKPQELGGEILKETEPAEIDGVKYLAGRNRFDPSFYLYKKKTVLIAPESLLESMITEKVGKSSLLTLLAAAKTDADVTAIVAIEPIRPLLNQVIGMAPPLPPPVQSLLTIPEHLDSLRAALNLMPNRPSSITFTGKNAASAQELETTLTDAMTFLKEVLLQQAAVSVTQADPPIQQALLQYFKRVGDNIEGKLKPVRKGNDVTISVEMNPSLATAPVLMGLLLPAVQQPRMAARRANSNNNLKQIGLAMHNYHDVHSEFPAQASYDKKKPLLSWRVHVLPFLEQQQLYDQFHLDEPWDSPHNKKLIEKMPEVYKNRTTDNSKFKTNFLVVKGEETLFPGEEALQIQDVIDGTSNTIMAVEADADQAVIWTKPADLEYDEKQPRKGLGNLRKRGFYALFADGSVRFLTNKLDLETLRGSVTPAGGEVLR